VLYKREHVLSLASTIVVSISYYGVKGGAFTLATAGNYRVWGPEGSFVYDNNALALATVMTIPLLVYFREQTTRRWLKWFILACILLSAISALGSQSRGALLAISAMSGFLWIKSQRKVALGAVISILAVALIAFMPSKWEQRMSTIATYEEDTSAMGRLEAWAMLTNLALDRPIVGGGFEPYTEENFARYNPTAAEARTAHSIYFQVLGEQGFVGLFIFLLFWMATWRMGTQIVKATRDRPGAAWANSLAKMVQVSLVGYLVGGAFLNLAYWDMPYYLMVLLVVTRHALKQKDDVAVAPARAVPIRTAAPAEVRSR
jgi:probable O-glycosylation ligase (exosortase A-associated)